MGSGYRYISTSHAHSYLNLFDIFLANETHIGQFSQLQEAPGIGHLSSRPAERGEPA